MNDWKEGQLKNHIEHLKREISRNEVSDDVLNKFRSCTESNPVVAQGVKDGISDKEIIIKLCDYMRQMNLETLRMMKKHQIIEREIDESVRGLFNDQ